MTESITVYGKSWCGDCARARRILDKRQMAYEWIDIEENADGARYVEQVNDGFQSVPTIVFPDGSILVEPSNKILEGKLEAYPAG
jgi:glutaredoxin-like protein